MVPMVLNQVAVTLSAAPRPAASHSVIAIAAGPGISVGQKFGQMSATYVNRNTHIKGFLLLIVTVKTVLHHTISRGLFLSVI